MKFLSALPAALLCLCSCDSLYSQTSTLIDKVPVFTSISFGSKIPDPLVQCANAAGANYPRLIDLNLDVPKLSPGCKNKYPDLFSFFTVPVSFETIITNRHKQILSVVLSLSFDRQTDSFQQKASLVVYNQLVKSITGLYGAPTHTEAGNGMDTAVLKQWKQEIPVMAAWNSNHKSIIIRAVYDSQYNGNALVAEIRDQAVEEPPELRMRD